jgi:hypothetical protein
MKKYQRATKNELETFLLRNNQVRAQPELFNDIYDTEGHIIYPDDISRKNELTGAGIEYVISYVEYICTHFKELVVKNTSGHYYESPPVEWGVFLDIVTGGVSGQRDRAAKEILRLHANPKPVLIRRNDGHVVSMQPFILIFDWGKPETMGARAAANLARMQKGADGLAKKREVEAARKENKLFNVDNIKILGMLPIESITVQFSKPLFNDFFRDRAGSYSFPTGMYAKMFKEANNLKESLRKEREEHGLTADDEIMKFDQEEYISAYTRFARYIMLHNNLTATDIKNKKHYSYLSFDLYKTLDFLSSVYPSAISTNGRGERRIDKPKFIKFISSAIAFYRCIPNFLLYPVLEYIDRHGFRLGIYTSMELADKADSEKREKESKNVAHYGREVSPITEGRSR